MEKEKKSPSVAVVILNWNGRNYLERFLPSVLQTSYPNYSLIVADNGSTDDSVPFLNTNFPDVRIIALGKNFGFAEGYNKALEKISADYYVLLNSDVEVTSEWIQPVIDLMEDDLMIAACQPKIRSLTRKIDFEYAGASGGWIDSYGYAFCRGRVFDLCEEDIGQYDDPAPIFWASGACLFVRSGLFRAAHGFDPFFFAHQEEIDLCWRLQNEGYKIFVQPMSVVYHLGGGSLQKGSPHKIFLNYRNSLILLSKNLPQPARLKVLFIRMVLDGISGLRLLFSGDWAAFLAVIKAHFGFYAWMIKRKTYTSKPRKQIKDIPGVYNGSIVFDYFLKKRKTFSDIVKN